MQFCYSLIYEFTHSKVGSKKIQVGQGLIKMNVVMDWDGANIEKSEKRYREKKKMTLGYGQIGQWQ